MADESSDAIEPFELHVDDADLDDLRDRLARTRWPEAETVDDWSQGVPLAWLQELCAYWAEGYDWRRCEARLNASGQYRTTLHGGGDEVMLREVFAQGEPDKYRRAADERSGLYSILVGAAANRCFATGQAVRIGDLVRGLARPVVAPMPDRRTAVPMPARV